MPLITKPDFTYVWASGGAIVAPNDTKKQTGWVAEAPAFQYDNWLQNRQDQMLAHINQRGIPAWDGLTNYEAGGLSYVQGGDGKVYKSVAASGPSTAAQNPTTDLSDTYWTIAFAEVGAFLTQATGDTRYAQLTNNLSDLTNTATARTNLGVVAATASVSGLVELATVTEVQAGTDTVRAITPAGVAGVAIGMGQTWQSFTGSRVVGTTYTNSTGRPIQISINTSDGTTSTLTISGVLVGRVAQSTGGLGYQLSAIIPNGATYVYAGSPINSWAELR